MLAMNNCVSQSTQKTPYEMVFGQSVRNNHDFWQEIHKQSTKNLILDEEEIEQAILNDFNILNESVNKINNFLFFYISF